MSITPELGNLQLKVVLIGDAAVGKTSLSVRFSKNTFDEKYLLTVAGSFARRSLHISNKKVLFQIWDTAGSERFKSIVPFYLRDADVALVTYDITDEATFENVKDWLRLLQESAPENVKIVLVGNKLDLTENRKVPQKEAELFAEKNNLLFIEASAKTGENIQKVFLDIGKVFLDMKTETKNNKLESTINIHKDTSSDLKKKSSCCS